MWETIAAIHSYVSIPYMDTVIRVFPLEMSAGMHALSAGSSLTFGQSPHRSRRSSNLAGGSSECLLQSQGPRRRSSNLAGLLQSRVGIEASSTFADEAEVRLGACLPAG